MLIGMNLPVVLFAVVAVWSRMRQMAQLSLVQGVCGFWTTFPCCPAWVLGKVTLAFIRMSFRFWHLRWAKTGAVW